MYSRVSVLGDGGGTRARAERGAERSWSCSSASGCVTEAALPLPADLRGSLPSGGFLTAPLCPQEPPFPGRPGLLGARRGSTSGRNCRSHWAAGVRKTPAVPTSEGTSRTLSPGACPLPLLSMPPAWHSRRRWWLPARPSLTSCQRCPCPPWPRRGTACLSQMCLHLTRRLS